MTKNCEILEKKVHTILDKKRVDLEREFFECSIEEAKKIIENSFLNTKLDADGLQFISVQKSPEENSLDGFWMLKDIGEI